MTSIVDSIEINATPAKIFDALAQVFSSNGGYKKWHKDHVSCKWIKGKALEEGSILYAEEYLHGKLHGLKARLTKTPTRWLLCGCVPRTSVVGCAACWAILA